MTPSDLKWLHENYCQQIGSPCHYFTRKSMSFFGDTMKNYGVRKGLCRKLDDPTPEPCYVLYRKKTVRHGMRSSAFFDLDGMRLSGRIEITD